MGTSIGDFVAANANFVWLMVFIALTLVMLSRQRVQFWLMDFFVTLRWFGTIARLSEITDKGKNGWLASEEKLCAKYKPYVSWLNEDKFNERIEYMQHAGDLGKTPMPIMLQALLFILIIAEGLGFSYLLGTWMAREGSANTHTLLMVAIVFVIAIILAALTHTAGHQYHRTTLLRSCFKRYKETSGKEYASKTMPLKDIQSGDAHEADYTRCINRVAKNSHDKGSYAAVWTLGVAIAAIFILSTVMRIYNLESELTRETTQQAQTAEGNPFDSLPSEVVAPQKHADTKAQQEITKNTTVEGGAAILMLGFIFVITQIVGFGAGYKYAFVGRESYKGLAVKDGAYVDTHGFSTFESYWATIRPIMDLANARLSDLQQRLKQKAHENLTLDKSFTDYLKDERKREQDALDEANGNGKKNEETQPTQPETSTYSAPATVVTLEQAKSNIAALPDKATQTDYFSKLPINIQVELKPWLKQRKEDEAAKQQIDLNELF